LTFRSLSIPESKFSTTWRHKANLQGKGHSGLSYSVIDEIPVSHLMETEKCWIVNLIRQSHLTNLLAADNAFGSFCDGVPLKFKKKNRQASSIPAQTI
jgi:hypothetical protein